MTTSDFLKEVNQPLDFFPSFGSHGCPTDTLSFLTDYTKTHDQSVYKLKRSNQFNFHRLMGGIYGEIIYHHGAGTRKRITYWDEDKSWRVRRINDKIAKKSARLLFRSYEKYLGYLGGHTAGPVWPLRMWNLARLSRKVRRISSLPVNQSVG